ncbi:MAG: hypothetical protein J6V35_04255 [Bacteroidales bacterium]|jgi:hypothetical protein|nr:hypothetical protein [Bacteroidales bacterium]MEE0889597.1 hypothetical protein [Bacteroidales bacterium]MEE1112027.1 hypothetical protein [Bacteroidales bacterium]MEE1142215.1 hypothetical protein [Bacteroidales bacterium]
MIDFYYVYEQIELWEQDLKHQEEILLSKDYVVSPEEESIKKVVSYLKSQSVYSKTLNENINLGLN